MHVVETYAVSSVTPYTWSENYQADIAMRQLEDCDVPCECPRCISLRITDCRGFSMKRNSVIFTDHLGTMSFTTRGFVMEYSYRDCLSEEIEILRLMLYRDEFSP